MPEHKKIVFRLPPGTGGYPPVEREGLWAIPLPNGSYVIDNIPFYAQGISADDEVEIDVVDGELFFKKLLKPSGNSTFRLILTEPSANGQVRAHLESLGCKSEYNGDIGLIAVEIPSATPIHRFINYLLEERANGALDFEEGT